MNLRSLAVKAEYAIRRMRFRNSTQYWEKRYRTGGNSGAGSYNRLASFKADVVNDFVASHGIRDVIEFGSGDGAQLELARYASYTGVDVSQSAVTVTSRKFANDPSKRFLHTSAAVGETAELALSLEVIYHLVEDEVFDTYMKHLFDAATRYVVVYSSNLDKSWPDAHVRHREFTRWVNTNRTEMKLLKKIPNAYPYSSDDPENTSFADFYVYEVSG